ncbi:hypothetical protein [Burkholderia seminalis]|uniref:hypothetical protein n=2 Tax=Burkholderia seminalis TaxID=488731 RepID=UPI0031D488EA
MHDASPRCSDEGKTPMASSNPITGYLLHASNPLPANVSLFYGRLRPEQPDLLGTHAFLIGGMLALVHGAWLIRRAKRNSIAIGIDLFFAIDAVLALMSPAGSRLWSEELGLAAPPIRVLVVRIMRTAWSDGGFVDGTFVDRARARSLSLVLLAVTAVTAVALAVSINDAAQPAVGRRRAGQYRVRAAAACRRRPARRRPAGPDRTGPLLTRRFAAPRRMSHDVSTAARPGHRVRTGRRSPACRHPGHAVRFEGGRERARRG